MHVPVVLDKNLPQLKDRLFAPFSSRRRSRLTYSRLPPALRAAYALMVLSDDNRLLYARNPKAGCTTICQVLYCYSKGTFFDGIIHRERGVLRRRWAHWLAYERALRSGSAFAFSFSRHPEARAVSAFQDFFVDLSNRTAKRHVPPLKARGFSQQNDLESNFSVFLDYIEESLAIDPLRTDRHWRPQVLVIDRSVVDFDFIGKVESLVEGIRTVFDMAGLSDRLTDEMLQARFNRSSEPKNPLSRSHRARIESIYAADYEAFGY